MNEVKAVKDLHTVEAISRKLLKTYGQQASDVWNFGLQVALRVSDLLNIKVSDIRNGKLYIVEGKTKKKAEIQLNNKAQEIVERIVKDNPSNIYLFQSVKSGLSKSRGIIKPISRQIVTRYFSSIGEEVGVELGTHSMRKTRGYHLYKQTNNIAKVMKMLRHSSEAVTLRYIGITQEDIDSDFNNLVL